MHYEEALKLWGARRLTKATGYTVEPHTVHVRMVFTEGFPCCGGSNPDCYCSFATSPSANVAISGTDTKGRPQCTTIDADSFDFAEVLGEIVEAAGTIDNRKADPDA